MNENVVAWLSHSSLSLDFSFCPSDVHMKKKSVGLLVVGMALDLQLERQDVPSPDVFWNAECELSKRYLCSAS